MPKFKSLLCLVLLLSAFLVSPPAEAQYQYCYQCDEFTPIGGEPRFVCSSGGLNTYDECYILCLYVSCICYTAGNFCYLV